MTLKEEANMVYDENGRALAIIDNYRHNRRVRRTPACTIGEYFAILTWLIERDEETSAE